MIQHYATSGGHCPSFPHHRFLFVRLPLLPSDEMVGDFEGKRRLRKSSAVSQEAGSRESLRDFVT